MNNNIIGSTTVGTIAVVPTRYQCVDHGEHTAIMTITMNDGPRQGAHPYCMVCLVETLDRLQVCWMEPV
jgi:hypothetical protein